MRPLDNRSSGWWFLVTLQSIVIASCTLLLVVHMGHGQCTSGNHRGCLALDTGFDSLATLVTLLAFFSPLKCSLQHVVEGVLQHNGQ